MAYTRPLASAANATWQGLAAYTRPLASAANATFSGSAAIGPYCAPSGFTNTFLGAPNAFATFGATGFVSTVFGTPIQTVRSAAGISTTFGTAVATVAFSVASTGPVSVFGTPSFPVNVIANAQGFLTTRNSSPSSINFRPPSLNNLWQTFGFCSTQFGVPDGGSLQTGAAAGFSSTASGAPRVMQTQSANGFASIQFGTPFTQLTQRALGFQSISVGTPYAAVTLPVTADLPRTQFGLPNTLRSSTFTAYGINASGRFGQPRGLNQFGYYASGFAAGALGAPTCFQRYLVAPTSPSSCFGKPLLRRNTQC